VVGVLFHDSKSNARAFLRQLRVQFPTVVDDGSIARAYGVDFKPGLPMTFSVSAKGTLKARHIGQLNAAAVTSLIAGARD
jgi:hypothetical protein